MALSLAQEGVTKETLHINFLVMKIFNLSTLSFLPAYFCGSEESLLKWTGFGQRVIELSLAPQTSPELKGETALWWKPAHKAVNLFARLLGRYGIADEDNEATITAAHKHLFASTFDSRFIGLFCTFVQSAVAGTAKPPEALLSVALRVLARSVGFGRVSQSTLRPRAVEVTTALLFPLLCATQEELALVESDPVEYVHQDLDVSLYSARLSARELLCEMCRAWPDTVLGPSLALAREVLLSQMASAVPPSHKYGGYEVVTALCKAASPSVPVAAAHIEELLKCCVVEDMRSQHATVRGAAAKCFTRFSSAHGWQDSAAFGRGLEALIGLAGDANLAVAVTAVLSLRFAVQTAAGKELLRPVLERVLELLYRFIEREDLDIDELVAVLESFVDVYRAEIAPYAWGICRHVAGVFTATAWAAVDDKDDNMISKASSCLSTLAVTCAAVSKSQALLAELGNALLPFIAGILSKSPEQYGCYAEEVMKLAHALLRRTESVPCSYWDIFLLTYKACAESPVEDYGCMHWVFMDFVTRTGQAFLANPSFSAMVLAVCTRVLNAAFVPQAESSNSSSSGEVEGDYGYELFKACQLAEAVVQHFPGRVDAFVDSLLTVLARDLCAASAGPALLSTMHKVLAAELVANCLYYNPALTLRALETSGALNILFAAWNSVKTKFSRPYDKKVSILGLGSVLLLPGCSLPQLVRGAVHQIIALLLYMNSKLEVQNKCKKNNNKKKQTPAPFKHIVLFIHFLCLIFFSVVIEREAKYGIANWNSSDEDNGSDDDFDDDDNNNGGEDNDEYFGDGDDDGFDGYYDNRKESVVNDAGETGYDYDECEDANTDEYFSMDCYDVEEDDYDDSDGSDGSTSGRRNPIDDVDVHAFLKRVFQVMSGEVYIQAVRLLSPEQRATIAGFLKY